MRKIQLLLIFAAVIGCAAYVMMQRETITDDGPSSQAELQPPQAETAKLSELVVERRQVHRGELLLIGPGHPVPEVDQAVETVNLYANQQLLDGFGIMDSDIELPTELLERFTTMVGAAKLDGITNFLVTSGYRGKALQAELYATNGPEYAHPPGFSEHESGLALDIGSKQGKMESAEEGRWLEQHAWRYGFILRYPPDKTEVTGVPYEPWHYRYVGLPHSAIMKQQGLVLEEYLAQLQEQGRAEIELDGTRYEVSYHPVEDVTRLTIPEGASYTLSGDNVGGVILTTW
ncbi:D-alanyl-D-alanine carboxypeptidase [Paenibacillus sp. 598K]|uniref:M15 family metallopeptidase n=1 Tax=Paenibacillus sp. 598K TaxID=1117987 RepID=UPI000FF97643|nr:M15 family metallopeptidase [Paenibacillus sp. 598K]GBF77984.1 D-alanyl-D-alanine carboxypeptidase [Paenibacillus sp. 598K]